MNKEDLKNYLEAKRQEVSAYLDISIGTSDDKTFYTILGMLKTLDLLEAYINRNYEIDILGEYIRNEYKLLKK